MSGLEVSDAVVRYAAVTAVDAVSLTVAPGEVVAVLGASGSGKSSLLRAVAGLEPLAGGRVAWDGVDLAEVPVHRRGFVVMFQDGQLFPHLNVGGNVGYALTGDRAARTARVSELLALVGLAGYADRPITALSGGEAQRVALARSLAAEPRLLLLDEPLSSLDAGLREHLTGVLADVLATTGTPALYVTHDQDEAFSIADRIAVLVAGQLRQLDTPERLWRHPADAEVAAFLGYGPALGAVSLAALGGVGDQPGPVLVGPQGLVVDPAGVPVRVLASDFIRGVTQASVQLPGGERAVVRVRGLAAFGDSVPVRLDGEACVGVAAADEPDATL